MDRDLNKKGFLTVIIATLCVFLGTTSALGQAKDVLDYHFNGTPTNGIKIKTNLPFENGKTIPTVIIEGFQYGGTNIIDIKLAWYIYNDIVNRATAISSSTYKPEIIIGDEGGKVVIFIDAQDYFSRFSVRVIEHGLNGTEEMFKNWTAVDQPFTGTKAHLVAYKTLGVDQLWKSDGANAAYLADNINNIIIGFNAGEANTSSHSVLMGTRTGQNNTGGYNNILGYEAGLNNQGTHNNFLGYRSGSNNQGSYNNYLGPESGFLGTTAQRNNAMGFRALYGNISGAYNNVFGHEAGSNSEGNFNNFLGLHAGKNTVSSNNNFFGREAGRNNTSGQSNIFVGHKSGFDNTTGNYNTFQGHFSGYSNTTANHNIAVGYYSFWQNKTGSYNINLGSSSGMNNVSGDGNTNLGTNSGRFNISGKYNVNLGYLAGEGNTSGDYNIITGYYAARYGAGSHNLFTGYFAGYNNTGSNNVSLGYQSGYNNTGSNNVSLGFQSGYNNTGNKNVMIGFRAGFNTTGSSLLYIDNSDSDAPLLYGEFDNDFLKVNGDFQVSDQVGINTLPLDDYPLAVDGTIKTTEVQVQPSPWPDYVFDPSYDLKPLSEVETHINNNGHLEGIPNSLEVEEHGIAIGEMNAKLLEKIEELTLYLIEQNKKIEELERKIEKLEKK